MPSPKIGIIMGSDSDLDIMKQSAEVLDMFGIEYEIEVISAHRTPERMAEYGKSARERGLKVIIAGAGGSAHLPGMTASYTTLPVVAIPIVREGKTDASIKSNNAMPPGVPLGVMSANGAVNGALYAVEIVSTSDQVVAVKLEQYRQKMHDQVMQTAKKLEQVGWENYFD